MPGSRENPIPTVGVVVYDPAADVVLLVRHEAAAAHETGSYGIPAGRYDAAYETEAGAAARELAEETGIEVLPSALTPTGYVYTAEIARKSGGPQWFSLQTFLLRVHQTEVVVTPTDVTTPEWVAVAEVEEFPAAAPNLTAIVCDATLLCARD